VRRNALFVRGRSLWRSPVGRIGRVVVLVAIAWYLLSSVDLAGALERAGRANPVIVTAAVLTLTGVHIVAALNWRSIVARLGGDPMSRLAAIRAYYASQALGGITPGNLGGDAYRVVAVRSVGGDWADAAMGVLVQRATSFAALAILGLVALVALPDVVGVAAPLIVAAVGLALLLAVPVLVLLRRGRHLAGIGRRRLFVAAMSLGLGGGALFHVIAIGASYALVIAVDPSASGVSIVAALTLARLSLAVPIAPSGIGVQEGALAALFILLGASPETAVAASLLGRLSLLTTTGIGLALVARRRSPSLSLVAGGEVSA
jgi:glycosyltransferase 2 family protein